MLDRMNFREDLGKTKKYSERDNDVKKYEQITVWLHLKNKKKLTYL